MADLGAVVDASQIEPSQDMTPVPPGDYLLMLDASEKKETKDKNGFLLNCVFVVADGQFKGRKIFFNFNLWNKSQQACEIAWRQFGDLLRATGFGNKPVRDSVEVHNIPFKATVSVEQSTGFSAKNDIKKFHAKDGVAAPTATAAPAGAPAAATPGKMPWQQ